MRPRSRYHDCGGLARPRMRSTARVGEAHRRETGRHPETLLRTGVDGVDAPRVDLDLDAAERRDHVDEQQRVGVPEHRERCDVVLHAGGRLRVHDREHAGAGMLAMRVEQALRVDRASPRRLHAHDFGAGPARNLTHALTEHTVDPDDHGVTRLDEIDEAGLHARRAGPAHGQRQRVLGSERDPQPVGDLVEHQEEVGIEMPEHRALERLHHLGVRVRRAGAQQETFGVLHDSDATRSSGPGRRGCRLPTRASRRTPSAASPTPPR